ncbi:MAG: hypothetical protein LLG20_18665 [Acidobacteriales bacterium]|nr:hypothetical protein [Terriglobales bacterium]
MILTLPAELEVFDMRFENVDYLVVERDSLMRVLESVRGANTTAPVVAQETPESAPEPPAPEPPAEVVRKQSQRAETAVPKKRASPKSDLVLAQLPGTLAEISLRLGWDKHRVSLHLNAMRKNGQIKNVDGKWTSLAEPGPLAEKVVAEPPEPPTVRDLKQELNAPKPDDSDDAPRITNRGLIHQALTEGPKTLIGVAQWVRAHGRPAMNTELAGVLLPQMERDGQVEWVESGTPGRVSMWQIAGGGENS